MQTIIPISEQLSSNNSYLLIYQHSEKQLKELLQERYEPLESLLQSCSQQQIKSCTPIQQNKQKIKSRAFSLVPQTNKFQKEHLKEEKRKRKIIDQRICEINKINTYLKSANFQQKKKSIENSNNINNQREFISSVMNEQIKSMHKSQRKDNENLHINCYINDSISKLEKRQFHTQKRNKRENCHGHSVDKCIKYHNKDAYSGKDLNR